MEDYQIEKQLIESAKLNPEKFGELYDKYVDLIYRYIFRRVDGKESAEDLTSKTFIDAFSHLPRYQYTGAPFSCWLYRIARNNVTDWYRKNKRAKVVSIEDQASSPVFQQEAAQPQELSNKQLQSEIKRSLELLDESDREIITLKYFEELSNKEISETMEISANHVGVKLFRALKKLRNILSNNNHL